MSRQLILPMKTIPVLCAIIASSIQSAILAGAFVANHHELDNRGLASTPRAREEFAADLNRAADLAPRRRVKASSATVAAALGGPRIREERPAIEEIANPLARSNQFYIGLTNRGLAANPRAAEENPQILRAARPGSGFQIAPLK